jgi:hypothetical protein
MSYLDDPTEGGRLLTPNTIVTVETRTGNLSMEKPLQQEKLERREGPSKPKTEHFWKRITKR